MKKLFFTTLFLTISFLPLSIITTKSQPLPTNREQSPTEQEIQQKVQTIAQNITVRITSEQSGGSGVIIAQKGNTYLILTNAHVVRQATQLQVQAPDGLKYKARRVDGGFSPKYDLALLQIESNSKYQLPDLSDLSTLDVNSRDIYTTGYPFDAKDLRITSGQISQLSDLPFNDGTQIGYTIDKGKKGIRQGMSGGPIFDAQGHLLGINTIGVAPILPDYTYNDGSKPIPKLKNLYRQANWGIPIYNFLTNVKADILYGYDNLPKVVHQSTPTGYTAGLNDKARHMTVRIENSDGSGSGVIVARQGNSYYVLTAKHVVQDEKNNTHQKFTNNRIITYDQDSHPVTSTVVAEGVDLAVIKFTSTSNYPVAKLGRYNTKDDDLVFVGGFPGRDKINSPLWQWQLNPGYIFSRERGKLGTQTDQSFTDGYDLIYGSISYGGMSGGPVFDTNGNVIGIHGRGEAANLNSLGISIQTFIGLAKANKLQIAPNLLTIDLNRPSNLSSADRQNVIATMENIAKPQAGDPGKLWLDYGNQLYRTRQYDKSVAAFDIAAKDRKFLLDGNYGKARTFAKLRKFDLAAIAISQAISAAPVNKKERANYYYLWNWQSTILGGLYKYDEALKSIDIAIALNPDDPKLYLEKASSLTGQRRYAAAITILDDIIRIKPEWYLYSKRSLAKSMQGDHQGAIADANTVIKLNPEYENAYVNRASNKLGMGDFQGAIADLDRAIKLNPNSDYAYQSRARIKNLGDFQGAIADSNRAIQINPQNPDYYDLRAEIKSTSKDYQGAIEDINLAIQIDPYYHGYYLSRGRIKSDSGDNRGAIIDYDRAVAIDPNAFNTYFARSRVKLDIEDNSGALQDASRAIELNPRVADIYSFRGQVKTKIGDRQGAMEDYDRAIAIDPKKAHIYLLRGNLKSKLGDYRGAISDFTKAIDVDLKNDGKYYLSFGNFGEYYSYRGDAKAKLGDKQGALNDYRESIKFSPKTNLDYVRRGMNKANLADYRGAIDDYTKAIELDPKSITTWSQRAVAKIKIADYRGAIIDLSKAIELDPKNTVSNANNYTLSALARKEIGDKKGAISDFTKAIEFNTKDKALYYFSRGVLKLQLGDNQGAVDDWTQAIKINPQYADAYNQRATIKLQSGDNQGALDDYTQAIKFDPKNTFNYILRGAAKSNLGDRQGALADLNKSIVLNPKYADDYVSRGNIKSQLGNKQEAILDYDKAIELNPKLDYVYISRSVAKFELGDNLGAISDTDRAIVINPKLAVAYANRGAFLIIDNKEREALPDLERAIELDPKMSYAYAGRGVVKETLGDKQGAISDYKQALKLNPQMIDEWKKQSESVRKYNAASYQKLQQMIQKLEAGNKAN